MDDQGLPERPLPAPVFTRVPVYTGRSGQPLVPTEAVIAFIRSVAAVADRHMEPADLSRALRREADALECQAIDKTRGAG